MKLTNTVGSKIGKDFFGYQLILLFKICDNLFNGSFDEEQMEVQAVTAKVEIVTQILKTIPMVIFALFLGPWSDKAGRKMLILLPFLGYFLYCITFIINVYFYDELVVEFLWFESIASYFGGFALLFLGGYGYIADTTSQNSRTIRIAVLDGMFSVAETIGGFVNGYIFASLGYYGSFGIASGCYLIGAMIIFFTVHDNKSKDEQERKAKVIDLKNVLESFKVLSKPRVHGLRHIVVILVICFQIGMFGFAGASYVDYLYIRRKFEWHDENTLVIIGKFSVSI